MTYDTIVQALVVVPSGESLFSEQATKIELEDEGAGLYVAVSQDGKDVASRKICLDEAEWPAVRAAIEQMMPACKPKQELNELGNNL